jgi:hypothetical protein
MNFFVCKKMNEARKHHIKWNNPDWERYILHIFFDIRNIALKNEW